MVVVEGSLSSANEFARSTGKILLVICDECRELGSQRALLSWLMRYLADSELGVGVFF